MTLFGPLKTTDTFKVKVFHFTRSVSTCFSIIIFQKLYSFIFETDKRQHPENKATQPGLLKQTPAQFLHSSYNIHTTRLCFILPIYLLTSYDFQALYDFRNKHLKEPVTHYLSKYMSKPIFPVNVMNWCASKKTKLEVIYLNYRDFFFF